MAHLIDKSALVAEIEKQRSAYISEPSKYKVLSRILSLINTLEVKEVDFWHKQSEEDIDDAINDWCVYSFLCIMKDGTTQKFTAVMDESYDGSINTHLDCVDDNYDWEYEDIIYWIEIPNIKAQKGEKV